MSAIQLLNRAALAAIKTTEELGHFGGIIVSRQGLQGAEFLTMGYSSSKYGLQIKFSGGMGNPGEDLRTTALREFFEETEPQSSFGAVMTRGPVYVYRSYDGHMKVFFAVHLIGTDAEVEYRKEPQEDGDAVLQPPKWISSQEALSSLHFHHHKALIASIPIMVKMDPNYRTMAEADPVLERHLQTY